MKKTLAFLVFTAGFSLQVFAQNVWDGGANIPSINTYGKVGIGVTTPSARLHIAHPNLSSTWTDVVRIEDYFSGFSSGVGNIFSVYTTELTAPPSPSTLLFAINRTQTVISNSLRIGAAAANGSYANYTLSVDGDMIAKRCVIQVSNWADYVFDDDYKMPTLGELETFINSNKHLPGVPSTDEALQNGVEVGDMNKILLQKVEELTLYMIDLQKQNEALKSRLDNLEHK